MKATYVVIPKDHKDSTDTNTQYPREYFFEFLPYDTAETTLIVGPAADMLTTGQGRDNRSGSGRLLR
eukprot:72699-Amorphochlora_amoeboformis.AAC.1